MPPGPSLTPPSSVRSAILVETKTKPALSAILTTSCVNSAPKKARHQSVSRFIAIYLDILCFPE